MEYAPCISQVAMLLADPKRSAMIWALMDGTARPADELALLAGVSTSSAGAHLARLATGGLLKQEARGRKRFFRLAAPEVGAAVEALASASLPAPTRSAGAYRNPCLPCPCDVRAFVVTTWVANWPLSFTSDCWRRDGSSGRSNASKSPARASPSSPSAVSMFRRWPSVNAIRYLPALTAVRAARIWAAHWAQACCSCSSSSDGYVRPKSPAHCRYRPTASERSARSRRRHNLALQSLRERLPGANLLAKRSAQSQGLIRRASRLFCARRSACCCVMPRCVCRAWKFSVT